MTATQRRVLVDNATLSGVERIIGISKTINLNYIDNDIICLEKLITAILFSDEVIGIDDYKDRYRSDRLKRFDFISFRKIEEERYSSLAKASAAFAKRMAFSFEGSKPAGDVVSFFESLRIDPQLRWDIYSSSEYLTLAYLVRDVGDIRHERGVDSVFRNENVDRDKVATGTNHEPSISVVDKPDIQSVKDLIKSFSSNNGNYVRIDRKSALDRIIFGYGWAAERSYLYNAFAEQEGIDAYLSPLRDAFCESCCRIDYPSHVNALLNNLKNKSQETVSSILDASGHAKFALKLPFFTSYLISKTDNAAQCLDLALSMRNLPHFRDCRSIFQNLNHLEFKDKIKEMNQIFSYLNHECNTLMRRYCISTDGGPQFSLSLGLAGPNASTSIKLNQLFQPYKNRPFARVFRRIAQDMINVERMGALYDKICSTINTDGDSMYPNIPRVPKFMESRENEYGRPAKP